MHTLPEQIGAATYKELQPRDSGKWKVSIVKVPGKVYGTKRVSQIIWSGSSLSDDMYDEFGLSLRLPPMANGEKIYFPVFQLSSIGWMNFTFIPSVPKIW
jgi:uncharacterized protein YcnI